jgi:YegS/Rv2252/BmrU family lipid kinase
MGPVARRFCLIANPVSGTRDRRALVEALASGLRARGHAVEVRLTAGPGDATAIAGAARADAVVAIGGDGTVTEVAEGLRGRDVPLGVVPAGTANVLARELALPWDAAVAVAALDGGRERPLDTGTCNGRRFLLMVGAGLDGAVAHAHTRAASGHNSYLRYVRPVWEAVRDMPLAPLRVTVDGQPMPDGVTSVVVGNVRGFGGVFEATSQAQPDDGVFDVIALTGRSRLRWAAYLAAALVRRLHEVPGAHTARGARVRIEADAPVPMQRDGDPFGFTPAEVSIEPAALRVIVP